MSRAAKKLDRQIEKYLAGIDLEGHFFEDFFASIVNTYEQYEDKNKMALRNLELSSGELNELNLKLEKLNSSMAAILDNLGLALLFFDKNGVCSSVYSKSCLEILRKDPAGNHIWEILELGEMQRKRFHSLIDFVFSNESAMGFEDLFKMAPTEIETRDRYLTVTYRPIYNIEHRLENILVIISDDTETIRTKNLLEEKQKSVERLVRVIKYRNDYVNLLSDINAYFLDENSPGFLKISSINELKGSIHTLKGLAGSFCMDGLSFIFHTVEEKLSAPGTSLEAARNYIQDHFSEIEKFYKAEISNARLILGEDFLQDKDVFQVCFDSLNKFYESLQASDTKLAEIFKNEFLNVSLIKSLKMLDMYRENAACKTGKKVSPCIIEGNDIKIPHLKYDPLINSFVHLIRNSVFHGIDLPDIREEKGKNRYGRISVHVDSFVENGITFARLTFSDDGAGFDMKQIRAAIAGKGYDVAVMSDSRILGTLIEEGATSCKEISQIAGRGVGLAEVRKQVEALDGKLIIPDQPKVEGSRIIIEFPLSRP